MTTISTRCQPTPATKVSVLRFVDVDGTGSPQPLSFEREVAWVVESESRVVYVHGGVELTEGPRHSDFYGFLLSVEAAVEEAAEAAERHAVGPESTLAVEVRSRLVARAVLPKPLPGALGGASYALVPDDWKVDGPGAVEAFAAFREGRGAYEELPDSVVSLHGVPDWETVTWSSKLDAAANVAARLGFVVLAREAGGGAAERRAA